MYMMLLEKRLLRGYCVEIFSHLIVLGTFDISLTSNHISASICESAKSVNINNKQLLLSTATCAATEHLAFYDA